MGILHIIRCCDSALSNLPFFQRCLAQESKCNTRLFEINTSIIPIREQTYLLEADRDTEISSAGIQGSSEQVCLIGQRIAPITSCTTVISILVNLVRL